MKTKAIFGLVASAAMMAPNVQAFEASDYWGHPVIPDTRLTDCAREAVVLNSNEGGFFSQFVKQTEKGIAYEFMMNGPGSEKTFALVYPNSNLASDIGAFGGTNVEELNARAMAVRSHLQRCLG